MLNSLRFRLMLIFISLAVGPLILVGAIIGQRGFTNLEQQGLALQHEVAAHVGSEIRAFVEERESELVFLDQVHGLGILDFEEQRAILSNVLLYQQIYQEIALLNSVGQEQIRLSRSRVILDDDLESRAGNEEFLFPATRGETYFGPVRFDETIREPLITISVPLFEQRRGEVVSVLVADLRFKAIWDLLADTELSAEGEVYVTDQAGQVVAHRNPAIVLRGTTMDLPEADGRAEGLSGTDVIIARDLLQFSDQELVVVAEQPISNALELATDSLRVAVVVTSAALVFAVALVVFTIRQIVRPIEALATSARAISSGDFSLQVEVSSQGEVGQLASAFNQMVSDLAESRERVEQYTRELESKNEQLRRELTERKQAEKALRQAKAAAEAANRAKSAFLANMSHELRTPLNAILGFTQLMARAPDLTAGQRENLDTIGRSGEHLLALINDVLELSKIEAGRVELQDENFDLHHMLLGLEEMFHIRAEAKGLHLTFERAPDVPQYIRADENKLRQVFINLLSNAVKFTHEGSITLRVTSKEYGVGSMEETSTALLPTSYSLLHFEVGDTGIGIAPDELDAVFDAFVQTSSGQQSQQGTGLGIPISHQFVRTMGGDLAVSSKVGKGSIFKFDIPVRLVDQSEIKDLKSRIHPGRVVGLEPDQPVYRMLAVEDVEANRKLLVKFLQPFADPAGNQGFKVREAVNGKEAIEIWEQWHPHLIWMDIRMPVMDGREATQRIKATPQGQNTIIVALTAGAFEKERAEALTAGCDDFVRKPFREVEIFDILIKHLGVRFVYEEIGESANQRVSKSASRRVDELEERVKKALTLVGMPAEWLADLRQATLEGDLVLIMTLIEQDRDQDVVLADRLAELAHNFDHRTILQLIQQATEN